MQAINYLLVFYSFNKGLRRMAEVSNGRSVHGVICPPCQVAEADLSAFIAAEIFFHSSFGHSSRSRILLFL